MNDPLQLYTTVQVAKLLSLRPDTINRLARAGELSGLQIGGRGDWRFSHSDVEAYLAKHRHNASA